MGDPGAVRRLLRGRGEGLIHTGRAGMDPVHSKGVTIVKQPFDMNLFLNKQIDAASAMTYNELAQVLETKNPKTGKLYKLSDLNVIKMEKIGTGMLEDGVFATDS